MSDLKVNVLKTVNKLTKEMVERKNQTWPPECTAILHQPKRPSVKLPVIFLCRNVFRSIKKSCCRKCESGSRLVRLM